MENSSLLFMTCEDLREHFGKCHGDDNKRILIIDVRSPALFERSHLCLDTRNSNSSTIRRMRVLNIDPDLVKTCTVKKIMSDILKDPHDIRVFSIRRDASEVVLIDSNTDDIRKIADPRSKIMRIINALTKFDSQPQDKITVPIHILKGGYREWLARYQHFTTNSAFDADADESEFIKSPSLPQPMIPNNHISKPTNTILSPTTPTPPIRPNSPVNPNTLIPTAPPVNQILLPAKPSSPQIPDKVLRPVINKPVPSPPRVIPTAPKPNMSKNAPGTAVPVTPIPSLRPTLARSHSSPNVAQADDEELDDSPTQFDKLNISTNHTTVNINNNHIMPQQLPSSKPRFDRTLKPSVNYEMIRAQLNFGRSPEASGKTIMGLQNLGNTCFMNSVIQCLAYTPPLVDYFCSGEYRNHINYNSQYGSKGELAVEFGELVARLNAHRYKYTEPKSFHEAVKKHIGFAGNEQQDSHEFMMMLFDKLHHDLNTRAKEKLKQNGIIPKSNDSNGGDSNNRAILGYQFWNKHLAHNKSIISQEFEGIFMSTLTCTFCKEQSNTFEVFNCLSLPIPSETRCHLRDCLNHFSNPERIEAAWECPRCKQKREADKKIVICKLPRILIIHLKRFSLDGRWRQKLQTAVDFPLADLSVDCTNVLPQSAYGITPPRSSYNLSAVVNHYGHLDGGHYTAFCKLENQRWYTFDDSNVCETKDTDVCGQAAYILFYGANF